MKKAISLLLMLILTLTLCSGSTAAEDGGAQGNPVPDAAVSAFPAAAERAIHVENEDAKPILFDADHLPEPFEACLVPDGTAHLRISIEPDDDPAWMVLCCDLGYTAEEKTIVELYNPELGAFVFDCPMSALSDGFYYVHCMLMDWELGSDDPDMREVFLIPDEAYIGEVAALIGEAGFENVRWEFAEPARETEPLKAYVLHVVDQFGAPVPDVYVNFCTDAACTLAQADAAGIIAFDGAPDTYHIQLLKLPDGYSADPGFELYTKPEYSEWALRVKKD